VAVGSNCINSRIIVVELFFNSYTRECYYRLGQALLERKYLIILVQGSLYILIELESRKLSLDLIDRVFQILVLLNVFEERSSQPLSGIKNRLADNLVP
jgi:hypothetical protein